MPSHARRHSRFSAVFTAGLVVSGSLGGSPLHPHGSAQEVLWLDLDKPKESAPAAPFIRNDGSTVPAGADLSLSLRDGKLILGGPAGPVALEDSSAASLELTSESTCVGFTVGESGSPAARHGWVVLSRDAGGSLVVHDWSCQTSPGAPLRPRPDPVVTAANHPLSLGHQIAESDLAAFRLQGRGDSTFSYPAISASSGLSSVSGSTLTLGGNLSLAGGTFSGGTLSMGDIGAFSGTSPASAGSLQLGSPGYAGTTLTSLGASYQWETGGLNVNGAGNLNLSLAGSGQPSGTWTIIGPSGVVGGFILDDYGFSNWTVQNVGSDIQLVYVPEPSAYAVFLGLAVIAVAFRRRRQS